MAEKKEKIKKNVVAAGKRKTAIAKASIKEGNGEVRINKKPLEFYPLFSKLKLIEPLKIAENVLGDKLKNVTIEVKVSSGGSESQMEAARLAIARALLQYFKNSQLKSAFLAYDRTLLVADVRRKEMRKPGDSKARAKRQTSYR